MLRPALAGAVVALSLLGCATTSSQGGDTLAAEAPAGELARLARLVGSWNGTAEWEANLRIARRAGVMLEGGLGVTSLPRITCTEPDNIVAGQVRPWMPPQACPSPVLAPLTSPAMTSTARRTPPSKSPLRKRGRMMSSKIRLA